MKIKNILFLAFIMSTTSTIAATLEENLSLMQSYLDKNQPEKVEDVYDENEEAMNKSPMALERYAISLERREKYKESIEIYRKIILNFYKSEHGRILANKAANIDPSIYEHTKLPFYYYKLAFLSSQIFLKTTDYTPVAERIKDKKNTEGFINLARKVKVDETDLKLLQEVLKEKIFEEMTKLYKQSWYGSVEILSWQDRIYLVTKSNSAKAGLLSTAIGSCLGGGKKWENINYEFNIEGCYVVGTATISAEDKTSGYQQSSVAVKGFIFGPGMYFKTFSDNVLLGVHLPIKYRTGDWTNPDEELYRFERDSALEAGFFIQSKIKVNKISLRTRLGKVFPNPGSLWSIGALYDF